MLSRRAESTALAPPPSRDVGPMATAVAHCGVTGLGLRRGETGGLRAFLTSLDEAGRAPSRWFEAARRGPSAGGDRRDAARAPACPRCVAAAHPCDGRGAPLRSRARHTRV